MHTEHNEILPVTHLSAQGHVGWQTSQGRGDYNPGPRADRKYIYE